MEINRLKQERSEDIERGDSEEEGYFLRGKRRRTSENFETSTYVCTRPYRRKTPIMHMPTEILLRIFGYMSNEDLANDVRLVNHRFRTVAQYILNRNFRELGGRIATLNKMIVVSIQHSHDDMEARCMCKMLHALEFISFYHSLIRSTMWRYIYFQPSPSNMCMYAGSILDTYNLVLRQFVTEPHRIYSPAIQRDYALSKEVRTICSNAKTFALYFDRITEMPVNQNTFCTGSKILDILDCATDCTRTVVSQKFSRNTLNLKLQYHFTYAWFVALDIPEDKPKAWNEQQRLMYMRLRRIVIGHSEMTMEYNQFKRERHVRPNPVSRVRRPINSVYTGYGEVGSKFFYYGVMNEGAYFSKFEIDQENIQDIIAQVEHNFHDEARPPFLGLDISVELKCPLQLAPFTFVEKHPKHDEHMLERSVLSPHKKVRGTFALRVDFECVAAKYPRLPTLYSYCLNNKR